MTTLQPGDLCVILGGPDIPDSCRGFVGRTVILIRDSEFLKHSCYAPFWKVVNLPDRIVVSHKILKKIPPAPMDESEMEQEELTV